jgi:hypothetical protein
MTTTETPQNPTVPAPPAAPVVSPAPVQATAGDRLALWVAVAAFTAIWLYGLYTLLSWLIHR